MEQKFELQPELTAVALAYRNKKLIADEIFPTVPVTQKAFEYRFYNKESFLTVPETEIGDKGIPNEAELKSKLMTDSCKDHALKETISVSKLDEAEKAGKGINLRSTATMQLADLMKLGREVKIANKLSTAANYGSNSKTMTANEKFTNDSFNPVKAIATACDEVFYQPNIMVVSRKVWTALRSNPYIVSAVKSVDVKAGLASVEGVKTLFGLDKLLVGEGVVNVAKKGQAPVFQTAWGNDLILAYINPVATTDYGLTFGYKATLDDLTIGTYFDSEPGTKGCEIVKAYETYKDVIAAPECGYIMKGVI